MRSHMKQYISIYRKALRRKGFKDLDEKIQSYTFKYLELGISDEYDKMSEYPSVDLEKIYAVVTMCLELKDYGFENDEILEMINDAFRRHKRFFFCIERIIDLFPCTWKLVKDWNHKDHEKRMANGSIRYDFYNETEDQISYRINKCIYVEIFEQYGIRDLCKIFCMADTQAYSHLKRHVKFVRHSDLCEGDCCHDEVIRRK